MLVKVHATTVNRTDCGFRGPKPFFVRAFTGLVRPRVRILGNEFAGRVEAVGPAVTSFAVGDRVFGYDDAACGAHAQYLTIREDASLARIPADLTYVQAAPATEGSHYALANIKKAKIRAGQRVLVNGATGAIGSAAVQLLTSRGVHVTAVCDTAHLELVRGLGAERVIDRTAEDFTQDEQTYHVVFDAVGKSSVRPMPTASGTAGGVSVYRPGPVRPEPVSGPRHPAAARQVGPVRLPAARPGDDELLQGPDGVRAFPTSHRPHLPAVAHRRGVYRYVETGQKVGNVVITVEQED